MHSIHCFLNFNLLLLLLFNPITGADVNSTTCIRDERVLRDKVIIITGAAQGIGYAIAEHFLREKAAVIIIIDILRNKGIDAEAKLNNKYGAGKAVFIECDVTTNWEEVADGIIEEYGIVDVLVNNAGTADEYNGKKTIVTNAIAPMDWSVKFWHHMRTDKGGCGGTIINVSAGFGYYIEPFLVYYISAAAASISFSKSLGHEYNYKKTGVRVLALCPHYTYTTLVDQPYVWEEQAVDYFKWLDYLPRQTADDVGKNTVEVFKNANSGTSWTIIGGEPPVESPISSTITLADMDLILKPRVH